MNNIFLPQDPLLFNSQQNDYRQLYEQKLLHDREQLDKQYNEYMNSLNKNLPDDKLTQLNSSIQQLPPEIKEQLTNNSEFVNLNKELQETVQAELVELVKSKINNNQSMVININRQIQIINDLDNASKEEERKNRNELNDYLKNYSNMTFAEYKKLKEAGNDKR